MPDPDPGLEGRWIGEIERYCPDVPYILIDTKADFRDENETKINGKLISEEDGRELAQKIGAKMFMECSALTQKNLKEVFINSIQCALEKKSKQTKNPRKRRNSTRTRKINFC